MCGIFCQLGLSSTQFVQDKVVYEHLKRRGPNSNNDTVLTSTSPCYHCFFSGHVLHMRGVLTPQPLHDSMGNILLWNGEIFGGLPVMPAENDTAVVLERLSSCSSPSDVLRVLSMLRGPWGFVYYQKAGDYLWFGRDYFGRRSLLWKFDPEVMALTLTSVAAYPSGPIQNAWKEVPAAGVYRADLKKVAEAGSFTFEIYPWAHAGGDLSPPSSETTWETIHSSCVVLMNHSGLTLTSPICPLNKATPKPLYDSAISSNSHASVEDLERLLAQTDKPDEVNGLIDVLSEAVRRRVLSLPCREQDESLHTDQATVAVLFSGGIDSMVLAALADRHIPANQPIDLLNVAFKLQEQKMQGNAKSSKKHLNKPADSVTNGGLGQKRSPFDVPDRITGKAGLKELKELNPERRWNFVEINVTQEELQEMRRERISHLVHPLDTVLDDSIGCAVWFATRGTGFITEDNDQKIFTSSAKVKNKHRSLYLLRTELYLTCWPLQRI